MRAAHSSTAQTTMLAMRNVCNATRTMQSKRTHAQTVMQLQNAAQRKQTRSATHAVCAHVAAAQSKAKRKRNSAASKSTHYVARTANAHFAIKRASNNSAVKSNTVAVRFCSATYFKCIANKQTHAQAMQQALYNVIVSNVYLLKANVNNTKQYTQHATLQSAMQHAQAIAQCSLSFTCYM